MENRNDNSSLEIMNIMHKQWDKQEVRRLNPLVLAYIGDAFYEVNIRHYLMKTQDTVVNQLHKRATKFVKAEAQASIIHYLMKSLTEEEITIVKRGRNSKSGTVPKNAALSDYRYATGFEALIGYLFLIQQQDRLMQIIAKSIDFIENQEL